MPVVLVTLHAYRSWSEDDARGYIQHGTGLQPTNDQLAKWREDHASQSPNRFESHQHVMLHRLMIDVCDAEHTTLHAASVTPTHLHLLISFHRPPCTCGASKAADVNPSAPPTRYHTKRCPVWQTGHNLAIRLKRVAGGKLSNQTNQPGRKWFSRGEHIAPVRGHDHYDYLVNTYLPKHEGEGGTVRIYGVAGANPRKPTD